MCMARFRRSIAKACLFLAAFVPIHFLYDWWPSPITAFFSENGGESIFQHMKIGFWAWIVASIVELLIWARKAPRKTAFIESRVFGAILIPYLQTIVWYLAPAFTGPIEQTVAEVCWSCIACFSAGLATSVLEWDLENGPSTLARKICLAALASICLFLFARFSYGPLPWIDVFAAPAP
jgi:hypothetical protein